MSERTSTQFEHLFTPIQVGTMALRNRIHMPTHGAAGAGNLWGPDEEVQRFIEYYATRARGGASWIGGSSGFVRNPLIPGFEPTGVGAMTIGLFRIPGFVERNARYMEALHKEGACGTIQLILMGGMPHGPSRVQSKPVENLVPHELEVEEIAEIVAEYAFSAEKALEASFDGVEIHANHDDLVQWFLSPLTNRREDDYGGPVENRVRFLNEILGAIRVSVGKRLTVGVRVVIDELTPGGYHVEDLREIMLHVEDTGNVDYWSLSIGNNWGSPSYIQPLHYELGQWAASRAVDLRKSTKIPVVFTGRVATVHAAEQLLAMGAADVVGMNRATIADPELPRKVREGRLDDIRPCLGVNECIHRFLVEGLPFGCAVNPTAGVELFHPPNPAASPRKVLVVGGGPAGMETAATAAERGHRVVLVERQAELGGQLNIAARAPMHEVFLDYVAYQSRRLDRLGVDIRLGTSATRETVDELAADVAVIATGARPRRPDIPGVDLPHVAEIRDVLLGKAVVGKRVLVIAQDDHMPPLSVADFLATRGHSVRIVYPSPDPAPLVGKYTRGGILQRLCANDVGFLQMLRAHRIEADHVVFRNVYTDREVVVDGFDTVVLACGGDSENSLYRELKGIVPALHILGDAYAPRRLMFATRQAFALGRML